MKAAKNGAGVLIKVKPGTKEILDSLKVVPEQTYDGVINDLLERCRIVKKNHNGV